MFGPVDDLMSGAARRWHLAAVAFLQPRHSSPLSPVGPPGGAFLARARVGKRPTTITLVLGCRASFPPTGAIAHIAGYSHPPAVAVNANPLLPRPAGLRRRVLSARETTIPRRLFISHNFAPLSTTILRLASARSFGRCGE